MPANYIPSKDADLNAWALNFYNNANGSPTTFGLSAGQMTTYQGLQSGFSDALAISIDPTTRTPVTVAAKDAAKSALIANSRLLAMIVQAHPGITPELLATLGLTVRDTTKSPVPAPTSWPILGLQNLGSFSAMIRFASSDSPDRRAKPFGALTCEIRVKYGATPPSSWNDADFLVDATKQKQIISFDVTKAGQTVWLLAKWKTRRGLYSPTGPAISSTVVG